MDCLSKDNFKKIAKRRGAFKHLLLSVIKEGIESGEFNNFNSNIVTLSILGMINWMYQWYNVNGRLSIEDITEVMTNLILNGLKTPGGNRFNKEPTF